MAPLVMDRNGGCRSDDPAACYDGTMETLLLIGFAAFFWVIWGRIGWVAIRTGRLLARGVVYERPSVMYWLGLVGMSGIGLLLTFMALWGVTRSLALPS